MSPALAWTALETLVPYAVLATALAAGLTASYARERESSRQPTRQWWVNRILILPLLAITAAAATEIFELSTSTAAFAAAMLSLGGFDALCMIESRWRARASGQALAEPRCGNADTEVPSALDEKSDSGGR